VSGAERVLLAFDFGLRRIGVASANFLTCTASPVATLRVGARIPWEDLDRIIAEWSPELLVVGLPRDGGRDALAAQVTRFVGALEQRYGLSVATVDESLTSHAAHAALRDARRAGHLRRRLRHRGLLDRHAACLIAEQWLSERQQKKADA
jgi:putative Holliday junction resolvase